MSINRYSWYRSVWHNWVFVMTIAWWR